MFGKIKDFVKQLPWLDSDGILCTPKQWQCARGIFQCKQGTLMKFHVEIDQLHTIDIDVFVFSHKHDTSIDPKQCK